MNENLTQQLSLLPELLGAHVLLSVLALSIGVTLSLPLGLALTRAPRLGSLVLAMASVMQTVPGIALLALMVPLLGAFGFLPALVALVLYSMLPVLRNTATGIAAVDATVIEAAVGMGMTEAQVLRRVQLPLALPVIVAGIRTAAVWVIGTATLSTPVGQASLGNYLFAGLQTRNWTAVLVGCAAAAALAVVVDALLAALESGLTRRRRAVVYLAVAGLCSLSLAGIAAPLVARSASADSLTPPTTAPEHASGPAPGAQALSKVRVGSKTFTEQYILARLIESRLQAAGLVVERVDSLGSTVAFDALVHGDLDVYVDYTGTLWANHMQRTDAKPGWQVLASTASWLAEQHAVRQLGPLGFENAYALAMPRERARELGITNVAELAPHAPQLRLGSDYEFFQRPEWTGLRRAYALEFQALVSFDATFMYSAVREGEVDVITAFSSDGRIAAFDLGVLDDPKQALPPYDAVLLLSARVAESAPVLDSLGPLIDSIPVELMRQANLRVDRDQEPNTPEQAAAWLWQQIQGRRAQGQ